MKTHCPNRRERTLITYSNLARPACSLASLPSLTSRKPREMLKRRIRGASRLVSGRMSFPKPPILICHCCRLGLLRMSHPRHCPVGWGRPDTESSSHRPKPSARSFHSSSAASVPPVSSWERLPSRQKSLHDFRPAPRPVAPSVVPTGRRHGPLGAEEAEVFLRGLIWAREEVLPQRLQNTGGGYY